MALIYGLYCPPDSRELEKMSELWRSYRTWVSLLLWVALEEETGEISGGSQRPAMQAPQVTKQGGNT